MSARNVVLAAAVVVVGSACGPTKKGVDAGVVISCSTPAQSCAGLGIDCGGFDAGNCTIDCGSCTFRRTDVAPTMTTGNPAMVSTSSGLVLGFGAGVGAGATLDVARPAPDGGFALEVVDGYQYSDAPGLAVDSTGTTWLAYENNSFQAEVAWSVPGGTADGGRYAHSVVGNSNSPPALALDSAGKPHVTYWTSTWNPATSTWSIFALHHDALLADAGWNDDIVATFDGGSFGPWVGVPSIAMDSSGTANIFYLINGVGLEHARSGPGGDSVELVSNRGGIYANGQLTVAEDSAGMMHVFWPNSPFEMLYAAQGSYGWRISSVTESQNGGRENALALDPAGLPHVAYHMPHAIVYGMGVNGYWSSQDVMPCDQGGMALAFDSSGALKMAEICNGLAVLTISGKYPADYVPICNQVTQSICGQSCACGQDGGTGNCCINASNGPSSMNMCTGFFGCPYNVGPAVCGDATRDAGTLYACDADLNALVCSAGTLDTSSTPCADLFLYP